MAREKRARQTRDELPPAPLGTMVSMLRSVLGTSDLALFDVRAGHIRPRYMDARTRSRAERVWAAHRGELLGGETVHAEGAAYFPIVQERVIGVLEVVGIDERALDRFARPLLMCVLRVLPEALACAGDGPAALAAAATLSRGAELMAADHADSKRVMRIALDELERQRLITLLDRHQWVVSAVARVLGVDRVTVYRKMEKFGLRRREPSPKAPRRGGGGNSMALPAVCR